MSVLPYDRSYDPPAPVVPLRVGGPSAATVVAALIDSGADVCVLPAELVRSLELREVGSVTVGGATGTELVATVYAATLGVGDASVTEEVVAFGHSALVGRNLLRHVVVTLDGPAREVTIG